MSQATAAIANMSRTLFRAAVNAALQAIQSLNAGATEPSETYPYMPWADSTTGWLKQRNAADSGWIFVRPLAGHAEADVASATTTDLGAATSDLVRITGTTTITGFGTSDAGRVVKVRHSGAVLLTHHATSLILPGGANITTAAGDTYEAESLGSGNWVVRAYQKASGLPVKGLLQVVSAAVTAASGTTTFPSDDTAPDISEGTEVWSQAITPGSTSNKVKVNGVLNVGGTGSMYVGVALFRGSTCLWSGERQIANNVEVKEVPINVYDAPASATAVTYSIRVGAMDGAGTWTVSDASTARLGAAAAGSTIDLMEIAP